MQSDLFILYGLSECEIIINKIIEDLKCKNYYFDLKLILTEAITNAFKHGNDMNEKQPIYLKYEYVKERKYIKFEVKDSGSDSGSDLGDIVVLDEITDDILEDTSGRGLYLIKSMSDNLYFKENAIIIEKYLN